MRGQGAGNLLGTLGTAATCHTCLHATARPELTCTFTRLLHTCLHCTCGTLHPPPAAFPPPLPSLLLHPLQSPTIPFSSLPAQAALPPVSSLPKTLHTDRGTGRKVTDLSLKNFVVVVYLFVVTFRWWRGDSLPCLLSLSSLSLISSISLLSSLSHHHLREENSDSHSRHSFLFLGVTCLWRGQAGAGLAWQ